MFIQQKGTVDFITVPQHLFYEKNVWLIHFGDLRDYTLRIGLCGHTLQIQIRSVVMDAFPNPSPIRKNERVSPDKVVPLIVSLPEPYEISRHKSHISFYVYFGVLPMGHAPSVGHGSRLSVG